MAMRRATLIVLNETAVPLAQRIACGIAQQFETEIAGLEGRVEGAQLTFSSLPALLGRCVAENRAIVGLCAAGILIRSIAGFLSDKRGEPPVIAVTPEGGYIVPLLGGLTGANEIAHTIADHIGGTAVVTASGSARFGLQLETPPMGYVLSNPEAAKRVTSDILAGGTLRLEGTAPWLADSGLPIAGDGEISICVSDHLVDGVTNGLVFHPLTLVVEVTQPQEVSAADIVSAVRSAGWAPQALTAIAVREGAGVAGFSRPAHLGGVGISIVRCGWADRLQHEAHDIGLEGCVLRRFPRPIEMAEYGRAPGSVTVVGLGPGDPRQATVAVRDALRQADDIVGYETYVAMVPGIRAHQRVHATPNRVEVDRATDALDLAQQGRRVAVVSSGDPGIFAMAGAVMEAMERNPARWPDVLVDILPGVSAMQTAAALVGAPLGHDFCTVSLSDIRKPWSAIETRLRAAVDGDFAIAIYNPASRDRRDQIAAAVALLLRRIGPDRVVIVGRNLGRSGEEISHTTLGRLDVSTIDMRTILIIGSSQTRAFAMPGGRIFVYTPRSYGEVLSRDLERLAVQD